MDLLRKNNKVNDYEYHERIKKYLRFLFSHKIICCEKMTADEVLFFQRVCLFSHSINMNFKNKNMDKYSISSFFNQYINNMFLNLSSVMFIILYNI